MRTPQASGRNQSDTFGSGTYTNKLDDSEKFSSGREVSHFENGIELQTSKEPHAMTTDEEYQMPKSLDAVRNPVYTARAGNSFQ
jgi:hypothetical protein